MKRNTKYAKSMLVILFSFAVVMTVESTYIKEKTDTLSTARSSEKVVTDTIRGEIVPSEKTVENPVKKAHPELQNKATEKSTEKATEQSTKKVTKEAAEKITVKATEKATRKTTEKATEKVTEKVTEKATVKATEKATEKATKKVVEKATEKATKKAAEKATETVTEKATHKSTEKTTEKATEKATKKITQVPTEPSTDVSYVKSTMSEEKDTVVPTEKATQLTAELQSLYNEQYERGYLIPIDNPDYLYSTGQVILCEADKELACQIVMGEAGGEGFEGCCLVAQCLKDSMVFLNYNSIAEVQKKCQYDGFREEYSQTAKDAVEYIFDQNRSAVAHRILFFYATDLCTSEWHESQLYVLTRRNSKFFDMW